MKKRKLKEVMKEVKFQYRYYFTDEFAEHGWSPALSICDLEDIIKLLLEAIILFDEEIEKLKNKK